MSYCGGGLLVLVAPVGLVLTAHPPAATPPPPECVTFSAHVTCAYSYFGVPQVFHVPDGVTTLSVRAVGGHGGHSTGTADVPAAAAPLSPGTSP